MDRESLAMGHMFSPEKERDREREMLAGLTGC
jgi:hypothetical protein